MEKVPHDNRFTYTLNSFSTKKGRSGYEPSDTETEWQDVPRHERKKAPPAAITASASSQPRRRQHSKSPFKPHRTGEDINDDNDDDDDVSLSTPIKGLNTKRNTSPLPKPDLGRTLSSYNRKHEQRTVAPSTVTEKPNHRRAVTATRLREQQRSSHVQNVGRTSSPLTRAMAQKQREVSPFKASSSVGEINEMIAEVKLYKNPTNDDHSELESTESIQPGDLFFSRECNALQGKNSSLPKSIQQCGYFSPRPGITAMNPTRGPPSSIQDHNSKGNGNLNVNMARGTSSGKAFSGSSSAATSRKGSSSVTSDTSGKTSESMRKFTANRKKNQKDTWFACMRTGNCRTARKSPERHPIDEASFIERAMVMESMPQFWADKHQPASLNGFICNKQEAQLLKELVKFSMLYYVSQGSCPHILLKGTSGCWKRELAMALLREIYGDACCNLSHELRQFPIQDKRPMKVCVPITYSSHHMELNVMDPNAKGALLGLIKEISNIHAITPEVSNINFKPDYKVVFLYEVDQAVENIQHMIKWIIDRYSDICKLVLFCEDDGGILEPVKNRFKVIKVDAPQTHEITEVLIQIAKKEEIDLSLNFAAKIATKSKQNLRKAIMALEACKAHNYPFSEEQPIPVGWEEIVIEVAAEILADPSFSRLLSIRGKFQMLLLDFVHPKLILQKLVEQLLKRVEASSKREVYYWHAYYDRRLPPGTTALLKLEEFVAKFMSIYRKGSSSSRQLV